ncbi:MAG: lipocalin-like domain-containing protein [Thermoanaerobaculia bacterium]
MTCLLAPSVAFAIVPAIVPAAVPADPPAVATSSASAFALAGTWVLEAADDLHPDGTRTPGYGLHPQGLLLIDPDGRYSLQIFRDDRPKFAAGDKRKGTPEEFSAAVLGMSSHIGRLSLDSAAGIVTFQIEAASFPNWDATEQKRHYTLEGDRFSYQVPANAASAGGSGNIPISVWRRVR